MGDHDPDLRPSGAMCRVCQKRPEIPDEKNGRCEVCAKAGRMALRFRVAPGALRQKWLTQLQAYASQVAARPHLGLHEVEMIVAKDHLDSVRVAPDLAAQGAAALQALRDAAERTDASW
jgi:hypothetical protein